MEVRLHERGVCKIGPTEVSPVQTRIIQVRSREVHFGEPSLLEVRLLEIRADVGVLITPCIPSGHALLEYRDVLLVCHRTLPVPIRIFSGSRGLTRGAGRSPQPRSGITAARRRRAPMSASMWADTRAKASLRPSHAWSLL